MLYGLGLVHASNRSRVLGDEDGDERKSIGIYWHPSESAPDERLDSRPRYFREFPNSPRGLVGDAATGQHRKVHLLAATPDSEGQAHVEGAPMRVTRGRKERVSVSSASRDHLEVDWDSATAMLIFDPSTSSGRENWGRCTHKASFSDSDPSQIHRNR